MPTLPSSFFLTGTDTGVGKTYVAAQLIRARRAQGMNCVGMKPICCGEREDAEVLHAASDELAPINDINPVWMRTPAAPYVASMIENRPVDVALIHEAFERLRQNHEQVIVEGVGGWRVPITKDFAVSDLASALRLPVIVVVLNRLGALNHTLLTVESILTHNMECAGVIVNNACCADGEESLAAVTNPATLEELLDVPVLGKLAYGGTFTG